MIQAICLSRILGEKREIGKYNFIKVGGLREGENAVKIYDAEMVKQLMRNNELWVLNLKLTKNNRLIYKPLEECEVHYEIIGKEQEVKKGKVERGKSVKLLYNINIHGKNFIYIKCADRKLRIPLDKCCLENYRFKNKGNCFSLNDFIEVEFSRGKYTVYEEYNIAWSEGTESWIRAKRPRVRIGNFINIKVLSEEDIELREFIRRRVLEHSENGGFRYKNKSI